MENSICLRQLTSDDLRATAILHQKAFGDSALSKLGLEPIRRYYAWQFTGPHSCYAVGAYDEHGALVGFCFAGIFRGSLTGFLAANKRFLIRWVLTHPWLIVSPLVIDRIRMAFRLFAGKRAPVPISYISKYPHFGILSIATDPEKQGLGIGKLIMNDVEREALARGYTRMQLTVHPTNLQAVGFYERCGWERVNDDVGEWQGRMIKVIA
jgi:ribosomal protein S18 acetylase RimI-like enzyme